MPTLKSLAFGAAITVITGSVLNVAAYSGQRGLQNAHFHAVHVDSAQDPRLARQVEQTLGLMII